MTTDEESRAERNRANLAKAREARRVKAAAKADQRQCIFCGIGFDTETLVKHLAVCALRPSDVEIDDAGEFLRMTPENAQPGTIVKMPGKPPMKVRWTRRYLEALCNGEAHRYDKRGNEIAFSWVTFMSPISTTVSYNGVQWYVQANEMARLPSPIVGTLVKSIEATRDALENTPRRMGMNVLPGGGLLREDSETQVPA